MPGKGMFNFITLNNIYIELIVTHKYGSEVPTKKILNPTTEPVVGTMPQANRYDKVLNPVATPAKTINNFKITVALN